MADHDVGSRMEEVEKELHLTKHRLNVLEQEQLPRRVASLEPIVQRMEYKIDVLAKQVELGLKEVKDAVLSQKALQKGVVAAVIAVVGLVQLLPFLKELLK